MIETSPSGADDAAWLAALAPGGRGREAAIARLHDHLVHVARGEAYRRAAHSPVHGRELDDVIQQAADDALLAVLAKLSQFRGESRFTTWTAKFVILEVAGKLTRHAWLRQRPEREPDDWDRLPDRFAFEPQEAAQWRELFVALRIAVEEELTAHQRQIFVALVLREVPVDVLAAELGTTRGALYKSLFDARRKLRLRLVAHGYMTETIVSGI